MQIQYCDSCNLRVDSSETVQIGEKLYCQTCAANVPRPAAKVATSGLHVKYASRSSGAGSAGASSTANRAARSTTAAPRYTAPAPHPQSDANKFTIWGLTVGGIVLAGLGVLLMSRGKPTPPEQSKATTEEKLNTPQTKAADQGHIVPPAERSEVVTTPPQDTATKPTIVGESAVDDIREGAAQRELDRIKQGKLAPAEAVRRLRKFIANYHSTKSGPDAEKLLKELQTTAGPRNPENPAATDPGVAIKVYENNKDKYRLASEDWKRFKFLRDAVNPDLVFENKEKFNSAFKVQDIFVLRCTGFIDVPADGEYTFYILSDDGSLLYFGDMLLIDNDGDHGATTEATESLPLKAGKHAFRLDYYQGRGDASLRFSWSGPNIPKQYIPAERFSH